MKRILFTGGGGAGFEAVYRLWRYKYDLYFADCNPSSISPIIPKDRCYEIPSADASNLVDALLRIAQSCALDFIIPAVDEELAKLAKLRDLFGNTTLLVPSEEFVNAMLDKMVCMDTLRQHNIATPDTTTLNNAKNLSFPVFVKPRVGRGSKNTYVIKSEEQLRALAILFDCRSEDILIQTYLKGEEYTVTMVADKAGNLRAIIPVSVKSKRGITIRGVTVRDEAVTFFCQNLHNALRPTGCYNIQLMKLADGTVMPFEINPRISTTFCLALAAGVDPVALYLTADTDTYLSPINAGVSLHRFWSNYIS